MTTLFAGFDPKSKSEWLAKVEKDLKEKSIDSLNWVLKDEINGTPFYHRDDLTNLPQPIVGNRSTNTWEIGAYLSLKDIAQTNQQAIYLLERGAEALFFSIDQKITQEELARLLQNIQLEWISTHFQISPNFFEPFCLEFIDFVQKQKLDIENLKVSFRSTYQASGKTNMQQLSEVKLALPKAAFLVVDAQAFYQGQDEIINELAQTIHAGNQILHQLYAKDEFKPEWISQIVFSLVVDDVYFLSIAKIRALKHLWRQVLGAWDSSINADSFIEIHLTQATQHNDKDYNKIKATTQAMSAVIGGANRLFIHPSDAFEGATGSNFTQRVALNIQHLLKDESYLNRVIDPSAGSYFIEQLTDTLAEKAWQTFQELSA